MELLILGIVLAFQSLVLVLALKSMKNKLESNLNEFPAKIFDTMRESLLASVRGDMSKNKGSIGELAAMTRLMAEYDSVVPDGRIADFIAFKLPGIENPGNMDFIEVKTGNSKTSKFQEAIKEIVRSGNIRFIEIRMQVNNETTSVKKVTESRRSK